MPSYRHHELGDLYVQIRVNFPPSIEPSVIPLLEQALPQRNQMAKINKKQHVDEVTLEEPNDRQKRSAAANGDEMDEDDDERPGVACAQRTSLFPIRFLFAPVSLTRTYRVNAKVLPATFSPVFPKSASPGVSLRAPILSSVYTPSPPIDIRVHTLGMSHDATSRTSKCSCLHLLYLQSSSAQLRPGRMTGDRHCDASR